MVTRGERLQVMLAEAELRTLDEWRFANRMPSRASAIRELLRRGLATEDPDTTPAGKKSKHFGVATGPRNIERKGKRI